MKNRSFLPLMEQLCMIAIFALAAVLCLQGFSLANRISKQQANKDKAVIAAQTAAEVLKSVSGNYATAASLYAGYYEDNTWQIPYDADWKPLPDSESGVHFLQAVPNDTADEFISSAIIRVYTNDQTLYTLTIAWQEVSDEN